MKRSLIAIITVTAAIATGCVSTSTHTQTLMELEEARRGSETLKKQTATAIADLKKQWAAEVDALQQEKMRLSNELLTAQSAANKAQQALETANAHLDHTLKAHRESEHEVKRLQDENQQIQQVSGELRRERDLLQSKAEDLQRRLDTAQQELASRSQGLENANARLTALEKEKEQLVAGLTKAQAQARDLATQLAAEQTQVASLRADKQRLLSGTTTAQEEVARLQKRAGELETEAARAADLAKQLSERDQELGKLRQATADRETLAAQVAALTAELNQTQQRISALTGELATLSDEAARTRQERDGLAAQVQKQQRALATSEETVKRLQAMLQEQEERLKAEAMDKIRLEQERAAKEAEILRLTQTHADLTKSLEAEIAKGEIRIKQVKDRLMINMVDRVLFDSGQAHVKASGLKVLKQLSAILKQTHDRQIRIEGHTDNVPIGAKLKERFPTNWELSTARAISVVRYLIEEGGVDPAKLSAVGYADTQPLASNDTEEGRAANRRIEIILYPKDFSEVAQTLEP